MSVCRAGGGVVVVVVVCVCVCVCMCVCVGGGDLRGRSLVGGWCSGGAGGGGGGGGLKHKILYQQKQMGINLPAASRYFSRGRVSYSRRYCINRSKWALTFQLLITLWSTG